MVQHANVLPSAFGAFVTKDIVPVHSEQDGMVYDA